MKNKYVTIRVDHELHKKLLEMSEDQDRSISSLIRVIIEEYIKKGE